MPGRARHQPRVYLAPLLQAGAGSAAHGYDVIDPPAGQRSSRWPGRSHARHRRRARDLGLVLDVVPNHMAIGGVGNRWWWDVLENGAASRYARYFDVDWGVPRDEAAPPRLLVPVLGDHYGRLLDAGEIRLGYDSGRFVIGYADHALPVAPRTL